MPKERFSEKAIPRFDEAPSAVLVTGDVEFFVEEAATKAREILGGADAEVLRFDDDAPPETVSDALLNRSLFSPKRIVELDVSRLLGTETPGRLLTQALEAWDRGGSAGRREAFKNARALLSALDVPPGGNPEETAEAVGKRLRKKDEAELLAEILRDMPDAKSGGDAILKSALRGLVARGENDGTVALLTAIAPPAGVDLVREIADKGLVLEASVGDAPEEALRRLAAVRAKEREVVIEPAAITRLLTLTDARPLQFSSELDKLLEWAGKGGRIRAGDIEANVEDEASEDIYGLYDAIGRRDAGDALARLERLLSGREVRAGDRELSTDEMWPIRFFGMLASEIRRMLLIRSRLEEAGQGSFDPSMSYQAFQARILPRLLAPAVPFGRSPFESERGGAHPFALFSAARRSSRFSAAELARALARAADVDAALKNSWTPLETLSAYVADLIAGR